LCRTQSQGCSNEKKKVCSNSDFIDLSDPSIINKQKHNSIEHIEHKSRVQAAKEKFSPSLFLVDCAKALKQTSVLQKEFALL